MPPPRPTWEKRGQRGGQRGGRGGLTPRAPEAYAWVGGGRRGGGRRPHFEDSFCSPASSGGGAGTGLLRPFSSRYLSMSGLRPHEMSISRSCGGRGEGGLAQRAGLSPCRPLASLDKVDAALVRVAVEQLLDHRHLRLLERVDRLLVVLLRRLRGAAGAASWGAVSRCGGLQAQAATLAGCDSAGCAPRSRRGGGGRRRCCGRWRRGPRSPSSCASSPSPEEREGSASRVRGVSGGGGEARAQQARGRQGGRWGGSPGREG